MQRSMRASILYFCFALLVMTFKVDARQSDSHKPDEIPIIRKKLSAWDGQRTLRKAIEIITKHHLTVIHMKCLHVGVLRTETLGVIRANVWRRKKAACVAPAETTKYVLVFEMKLLKKKFRVLSPGSEFANWRDW